MKHARADYNRMGHDPALDNPELLTPGSTPIAEDEPVCLFRAQDKNFNKVMEAYMLLLVNDPDIKPDIIASVANHIVVATEWQKKNGKKTPDL